jgi:hypothetical protein
MTTMTFRPGPSTSPMPAFLLSEGELLLDPDGTVSTVTWVGVADNEVRIAFLPQGSTVVREMRVPALRDMKIYNP